MLMDVRSVGERLRISCCLTYFQLKLGSFVLVVDLVANVRRIGNLASLVTLRY